MSIEPKAVESFEPADPNYRERVISSFGRQQAMRTLGIEISSVEPGRVELSFSRREALTQQHGFIHAGVIATALDSACGYAAFSLMTADAAVLTVEYKVNLLRPAQDDRYLARAWVVKPGRTLTVCHAEAVPASSDRPVAIMTGTIMTLIGSGLEA